MGPRALLILTVLHHELGVSKTNVTSSSLAAPNDPDLREAETSRHVHRAKFQKQCHGSDLLHDLNSIPVLKSRKCKRLTAGRVQDFSVGVLTEIKGTTFEGKEGTIASCQYLEVLVPK